MRPFSTPKVWLLLCASIAVLAASWRFFPAFPRSEGPRSWLAVLPVVWLVSWITSSLFAAVVSREALLTAVAAGLWAMALLAVRPRSRQLAVAVALGGAAVAAVALLQWSGLDPFVTAGWTPQIEGASVRMRIYSTIGNPNFVAALLVGTVPVTAAIAAVADRPSYRLLFYSAVALELMAIAFTGSRGGALGLVAAAGTWIAVRGHGRMAVGTAALAIAAIVALSSEGRPIRQTLEGRLYIWRVLSGHALAHPWVGYGPGGVEANYRDWERSGRATSGRRSAALEFAGPQQHAHNDYLEALVERGIPGLVTLLLIVALPVASAVRAAAHGKHDLLAAGAAGAIAGLAAAAAVDYPFGRPAELLVFWAAVVILTVAPAEDQSPASPRHRSGGTHAYGCG
jgi:putative inorganic carbon (HCO3(-)) transporter